MHCDLGLGLHCCEASSCRFRRARRRLVADTPSCLLSSLLQDADIVVVEFAMNDGTNVDCARDGSGTVPARASFERLLRKLQALPNRPAVIVLNAYSFIRGSVGSYLKVWCVCFGCVDVPGPVTLLAVLGPCGRRDTFVAVHSSAVGWKGMAS